MIPPAPLDENDDDFSLDELNDHFVNSFSGLGFIQAYRDFFLILDVMPALFLNDLVNRHAMLSRKRNKLLKQGHFRKATQVKISEDGYFLCSYKFLQTPSYPPIWSRNRQETLTAKLISFRYIKIRRQGRDGARWVYINGLRIRKDIDRAIRNIGKNLDKH